MVAAVSWQLILPISKGQAGQEEFLDCLTLGDRKEAVSTNYQHTPRNNPEKRRLELHSN